MKKFNLTRDRILKYKGFQAGTIVKTKAGKYECRPYQNNNIFLNGIGFYIIYDYTGKSLHLSFIGEQYSANSGYSEPNGFESTMYNIRKGRTLPSRKLKALLDSGRTLKVFYLRPVDAVNMCIDFVNQSKMNQADLFVANYNPLYILRTVDNKQAYQNLSSIRLVMRRMFDFITQ